LQLGVLLLPAGLEADELERYRQLVAITGAEPSLLIVDAAVRLLADPWFSEVYLEERRAIFASRYEMLWKEVPRALPEHARMYPTSGGLNTWIEWGSPTAGAAVQENRVVSMLLEEGLELTPGSAFRVPDEAADTLRRPAVRFPFGHTEIAELQHWLRRLGAALLN
jgi:DNA-binding transcriptional MocR family regulator